VSADTITAVSAASACSEPPTHVGAIGRSHVTLRLAQHPQAQQDDSYL
jgi:hypothetical protein